MTAILGESLLILTLILANGVFAMSEIAVVTASKVRLRLRSEAGDHRARRALELADHPNRFLSTVQIGITMIGIFAGAYGGATIAREIEPLIAGVPALASYADELALAAVVLAITYLSLVFGELVPKRLALGAPERVASLIARPMHAISVGAAPVVKLLSISTDGVLSLIGMRRRVEPGVTEEEITKLLEQGVRDGEFEADEPRLVERVFRLADLKVSSVMTPRQQIVWLDANAPAERHHATMASHRHSRFLVCDGALDRVRGVVDVKDLWARAMREQPLDLEATLLQPLFVPEHAPALQLLNRFRASGVHLALVLAEDGSVQGLATLNDVLEEITGELEPVPEPGWVRRDDGSLLVDGWLGVDELAAAATIDEADTRSIPDARTVAGIVVTALGRLPRVGESIEVVGLTFEVVDMDGPHIDKVLVARSGGRATSPID
jgi:putative hemolysin